jgi:ATP-dependent helicase/DNAse subunit B
VVERAFRELIRRDPVLVVPGVDDIFGWEERLTREDGAMVGGQVMHFRDLCAEIVAGAGAPKMDVAGELQRLALVEIAISEHNPALSERMPEQPGIAASVLELIDDFRAETKDAATLGGAISESGRRRLGWLAQAYDRYLALLAERGLTDGPNEVSRALNLLSESWAGRPVFFAGFDDMTGQQFEMVRRLAVERGAMVTVALSHQEDNPALDLSNSLMAALLDLGPGTQLTERATTRGQEDVPHDAALLELEARFLKDLPEETPKLPATERVTVMRSSGSRNEAEAIGAEIAKLVAEGVPPDRIAIAVSAPAVNGPLIRDVLTRFGIPVALESETAVRATSVGASVLALIRAAREQSGPRMAFEWLRSPAGPQTAKVDRAELKAAVFEDRRAEAAIARVDETGSGGLAAWATLTAAVRDREPVYAIVAGVADDLARSVLAADTGPVPSAATVIETQAATSIARACRELESINGPGGTGLDEIRAAIESGVVKLWSVPAAGTVRIASPYSLRAKRFSHLFMASQQEGGIQDSDRAGPFLSADDREALGMRPRTDPEVQARYLFYSCLTVPTERLWISCRTSDEAGKAEHPSPLIAAVEELFETGPDGEPGVAKGGRTGSDIVFNPVDAPSLREAARGLAATGEKPGRELGEYAEGLERSLAAARVLEESTRTLADLSLEAIKEDLADDPIFSPTEIEAYAGCPYRWFIERRMSPQRFGPDPDYFTLGSLLHGVLEEVYSRFAGAVPRAHTVDSWLAEVPGIVAACAADKGIRLDGSDPVSTGQRIKAERLISLYLRREAERDEPLHLPAEFEYSFGIGDDGPEAVEVSGWKVRGKIDRIDLSPEAADGSPREAVVVDFKSGHVDKLSWQKSEDERRLQLQIYLHAAKAAGCVPVAGLYESLRPDSKGPRGAYAASVAAEMAKRGANEKDVVPDQVDAEAGPGGEAGTEPFGMDGFIAEGLLRADQSVRRILDGVLEHDPATCPDHLDHPAVPDRHDEDADENGGSSWD